MNTPVRPRIFLAWDLLVLAGLLGLFALWRSLSPGLPDPVPSHFDALGRVNGWTPRAQLPWMLFGLPLLLWGLLFAVGAGMSQGMADPAKARAAALGPLRGCVGLGLWVLMGTFLAVHAEGLGILKYGAGLFVLLVLGGIAGTIVQTTRLMAGAPDGEHYRWGTFYVNPEDPRLWVPKRIGIGSTLNYARPAAFWITALLVLPALLIPLAILLFAR